MTKLSAWKMAGAVLVLCAVTAIVSPAQTFDTVFNFDGTDGYYPFYVTLVQGADGNSTGQQARLALALPLESPPAAG